MEQIHKLLLHELSMSDALPRLDSLPVSASDSTTTTGHFGQTKLVPNEMYHLLPVLVGSGELSFTLQGGVPLGAWRHVKTMNCSDAPLGTCICPPSPASPCLWKQVLGVLFLHRKRRSHQITSAGGMSGVVKEVRGWRGWTKTVKEQFPGLLYESSVWTILE